MKLILNSLIKKRVVSTLFLYILILSCDFEAPQKWETPSWYMPMTIPLVNEKYSFEGFVDSTIIFSDSINNVIQIVFADSLGSPQGIPNETFNIDMSAASSITLPDLSSYAQTIKAPKLDPISTDDIPPFPNPIFGQLYNSTSDCFPRSWLDSLQGFIDDNSDLMKGSIPLEFDLGSQIDLKEIFITEGDMSFSVINDWAVPIQVVFELKNGEDYIFQSPATTINPYTTPDKYIVNISELDPVIINMKESLVYTLSVTMVDDSYGCSVYECPLVAGLPYDVNKCSSSCFLASCAEEEEGWTIQSGDGLEELSFLFQANFNTIGAIVANMNLDIGDALDPLSIPIPSMAGISITNAKFDVSDDEYPNEFIIDITNDFIQDFNMIMSFENIFNYELDIDGNENLTESLVDTIVVKPGETLKEVIQISEKFLANGPNSSDAIDSIKISYDIGFDNSKDDTLYFVNDELDIGVPKINQIDITNLRLQYIFAVTKDLSFPTIESPPISGIPDGFSGFQFYDIMMEFDFKNEIGIPVDLNLLLEGSKTGVNDTARVEINSQIGAPYENNYGCKFNTTGDIARTVIKLNRGYITSEYYCDTLALEPSQIDTNVWYSHPDSTGASTSIAGLMNFGPENISVGGGVTIEGEGILAPNTKLWGTFSLNAPLAFIFEESINIIPAGATAMAPIDPSSSSQLDSALVEAALNVKISNSSALGGNLSLLISDSTIFPLFLDSLKTGSWENQIYNFNTTIWDTLEPPLKIDSIYFEAIDPNALEEDRQALKVEFYKNSELQFFIGRMFELAFPATDSVEYNLGFVNPDFPKNSTSTLAIDKTRMNWVFTEENRFNIAMMSFDKSLADPRDTSQLVPLTFQTTNFLDVQAYLTLLLNIAELGRDR